jgi:hypothetical protein
LSADGHEVRFLDLCFERDPVEATIRAATEFAPTIAGVSVRNIDNSDAIALRHYTPDAGAVFSAPRSVLHRRDSSTASMSIMQ